MKKMKWIKAAIVLLIGVGFAQAAFIGVVLGQSQSEQPVVVPAPPRGPAGAPSSTPEQRVEPRTTRIRGRFLIPKDTPLNVRLAQSLSSERNESGDDFEVIFDEDVRDQSGQVVIPKGSKGVGRLFDVRDAGRVKGRSEMTLELTEVYIGDDRYTVQTHPLKFQAEGGVKSDAKKVGIAAGIGAIIGAIAGGGKGAAVGAAIGGSAGTAGVLITKGEHIDLRQERLLSFRLEEDLEINR